MSIEPRSALTTVLQTLRTHRPASRATLARLTGLSPSVITTSTRTLIERGLVEETGTRQDSLGRPQVLLTLRPDYASVIGLAMTWQGLSAAVTDLDGQVQAHRSAALTDTQPDSVLAAARALVGALREQVGIAPPIGVGWALPGWIDSAHGVCRKATALGWAQVPFGPRLADALALPVHVENDANALAVAEKWFGGAAACSNYAVVTLSSGIGAGLFLQGRLYRGTRGATGEIGHLCLDPNGPLCNCGRRGCFEALASVPALLRDARAAGLPGTLDALLAAAEADDTAAQARWQQIGEHVGHALSSLVLLLDPQEVVVTAPAAYLNRFVREQVSQSFAGHGTLFGDSVPPLRFVSEDEASWARSAASLAIQAFFERGGERAAA